MMLNLTQAILHTIAYADIFNYPLTLGELHRYLHACRTDLSTLADYLQNGNLVPHKLSRCGPYFTLPGREAIIPLRQRRDRIARKLWGAALRYGRLIASFPFVRMVAITGALAVRNTDEDSDLDYFIVTEPGYLWLCRGLLILLVRLVELKGITLCPNYLLSERVLALKEQDLFTAREITQMVPLSGFDLYRRMRALNAWTFQFLPNAIGPPSGTPAQEPPFSHLKSWGESLLRSSLGERIERWEMQRKIRKFSSLQPNHPEARFTADLCQGHFDSYKTRTLETYYSRLNSVLKA